MLTLTVRKREGRRASGRPVGSAFGTPVRVLSPESKPIAVGMTNYSSVEIRQLIGVKSAQIATVLGYTYGEEVIHRNDLVLM